VEFSEKRPRRHGILTASARWTVFCAELVQQMARDRIDVALLSGLPSDTAEQLAAGAMAAGVPCTIRAPGGDGAKPGFSFEDLCAIDTSRPWAEYLASRSAQMRNNIRRAYRLAAGIGDISLWRYLADRTVLGSSLTLDQMVTWVDLVAQNSWQHS